MKKIIFIALIYCLISISGCTNSSPSGKQNSSPENMEFIHYKTEGDNKNRHEDSIYPELDGENYEQSQNRLEKFNEVNDREMETDIYYNEETQKVSALLTELDEIKKVQVVAIDDRIVVAATLSDHAEQDIGNFIEEKVRTVVQDKDIVVYTDYTEWHQENDERAKPARDTIQKFLNDFFQ